MVCKQGEKGECMIVVLRGLVCRVQVNMSIAILPMSADFKWGPTTVGLVQSSFFWGYLLTQVYIPLNFLLALSAAEVVCNYRYASLAIGA